MASRDERVAQLRAAIAAQEALRPTLGDAVVDVTLAALHAQLEAVEDPPAPADRASAELSPELVLARLRSYLPHELADKMRATGRIEGERKLVTVVFADLTGFTALGERLDPEDVALLANEVLEELAEAVYQHEGYIDTFAGDAIMAVFGAPVAHEDDPERALRAALAMRERLRQHSRRWEERLGHPLALHVGINTGTVVAGPVGSDLRLTYTVMGDTVNTASRLRDVARPGQILVSRDTHRLTREAFTFASLGPLTLRGKREPLDVFELERARLHPGKTRGLQDLAPAFVGRDDAVARLRTVRDELRAGRGRLVAVTGEAGIGKSRLLAEWRSRVGHEAGWLEGRAFAHTTGLAYGPFLDLFRRYAGIRDDDSESVARSRLHAAVERVFPGDLQAHALFADLLTLRLSPDEQAVLGTLPREARRRRLFDLVSDIFARATPERPIWLILEDLHWADQTSLDLIEHLLPLTERVPLAIVAVYRSDSDALPRTLQAIGGGLHADRLTHIALSPLPETSSLEMVQQLLGTGDVPDPVRALIRGKTEGNPFFVEEVIRALIERGALVRADGDGRWETTPLIERMAVPDTLQGLLMARLDHLPDETKWVAQQAAVIGRIFLYRVLLRMAERTAGIEADLGHLEREDLIRERTRRPEVEYIFKHALTQEVAYGSLLAPRRRELHRRVAEAMEDLFADRLGEFYSILAEHFLRGEAWDKATAYFILAGDAAAGLYAHAEARLHYGKALDALTHLADDLENRRRRVDTTVKLVGVSLMSDSPRVNLTRLSEVEPVARALPGPDGTPGGDRLRLARIHLLIGRSHHYLNELREAIAYFERVLAVAQEPGAEELLALPSAVIGRVVGIQGHFGKSAALLARAIPLFEQEGNWPEWIWATGFLGLSLAARGQIGAAVETGHRALARAGATNYPTAIAAGHILLSGIYLLSGDAEQMLRSGRDALAVAERAEEHLYACLACYIRGWAEGRLGQHEAALASMAEAKAMGQSLGGRLLLVDWFAAAEAEITLSAGRAEGAATLAAEAVRVAQAAGGIFAEGLARRTWGQALAALESPGEGEAHLARSVELLEAGECHVEVARSRAAWGLLCRDRGEPTAALEHFERAAAGFEAAGLTAELERTRSWMPRVGGG